MRRSLPTLLLFAFALQGPGDAWSADPEAAARLIPAAAQASSASDPNSAAEKAGDGDPQTRWSSKNTDHEWLTIDLGQERTIGEAVLVWEAACGEVYQVQVSADGTTWYVVFTETAGEPGRRQISFDPVSARYVRMYGIKRKTDWGYSLFAFDVFPSSAAPTALNHFPAAAGFRFNRTELRPRAHSQATAGVAPKGYYPFWLSNQQEYWTVTGTAEGTAESLISEHGSVELHPRAWSLMPYLLVGGRFVTSRDVELTQSLEQDYLPIPSVDWKVGGLVFSQKLFTWGEGGLDTSYLLYTLENKGTGDQRGTLFVTVRPFQVSPFWQGSGGMADVFSLRLKQDPDGHAVLVNETQLLYCVTAPDAVGGISFQEGDIFDYIPQGKVPPHATVFDPWGGASAALRYDFALRPGGRAEYIFAAPLKGAAAPRQLAAEAVHRELEKARSFWVDTLNRVKIETADPYPFNVLRANLAYLLINKDGPVVQPGARNYERSWIRDGSLMAIALLRTGHPEDAKAYVQWAADHQLFSGDVPCMINADGSQWDWGKTLPEYDGQGAFVTMVAEYYAYTKDRELLSGVFTNVTRALGFLDYLRKKRLTDEYRTATGEKARFYGILPISVSHEGYTQPGKHSYWDDFWAVRGWREGQAMARLLGRDDLIPWMAKEETELRANLLASIAKTQKDKGVSYIPGCAELGDNGCADIAVWPTDAYLYLPREQLQETLETFYRDTFLPRLGPNPKPEALALPYEMRNITAHLILGQKQRAWELMDYFLKGTRPRGWNHWGEVIYVDYRRPDYIGDMPHSWGGSDFIHAFRTVFLYEDQGSLKLGPGIREDWLAGGQKVAISDAPTHYGNISYTITREGARVLARVEGTGEPPPKGYVLVSPLAAPIKQVTLNGKVSDNFTGDQVRFSVLPADIAIAY
ncbi:MAG: discoidin domain-containing protein [Verrucomicrobiota bacterium]